MNEDTDAIDRALIADELLSVAKLALIRKLPKVAVDIQKLAEEVRHNAKAHHPDPA